MTPSTSEHAVPENDLLEHFRSSPLTMGVVGLGYVGLPLTVEAAGRGGMRVIGFDVSDSVVEGVNAGVSHIQDLTDDQVGELVREGKVEATTDMSRMAECDVISICVPTPLSKTRDPDVSYVIAATEAVKASLRKGQLIILESTTYPGTTREVMLPELEATGLEVGEDFYLCFSPERVDPGNQVWQTHNTPKVIGGVTEACTQAGVAVYERFIETMVPVSSTDAAELTKILENTFRAVNIGLVNELAQIADLLKVDIWEVIDAAATKPFGFMKFTPGPGLGGHCIPVDPHYLSWRMKALNYKTRFIELASEVNGEMPLYWVEKVRKALNAQKKAVNGSRILLLGMAYKADIDDLRESPSLDVMRLLQREGAEVLYHDPYVPVLDWEGVKGESVELDAELLATVDVAVVLTAHTGVDHRRVIDGVPAVVDTRNAVSKDLSRVQLT